MTSRLIVGLMLLVGVSCTPKSTAPSQDPYGFQADLQVELTENMPGILVSVISQDKNIRWTGAAGFSDISNQTILHPEQTFRIASVTKTFVAATILRLWEDKKLKLDDPIVRYISKEHADILFQGGYNPHEITILQLLSHSSGLSEHTRTEKYQLPNLLSNYVWSRTEQLEELSEFTTPIGKPGKQFSYSDSGYILLGEIIESITQMTLGDAIVKELNLRELGLKSIHMEQPEGEFASNRIHQYINQIDTYSINPTLDLYGGGGLLASVEDLSHFYLYLFENKIFKNVETLERMLAPIPFDTAQALDYRMGIWRIEIDHKEAYTHTGFWGTQVLCIPEIRTCIAVNYSQKWEAKGTAPIISKLLAKLL